MMQKFSAAVLLVLTAGWLARVEAQGVPALENIKSDAELKRAVTALDAALFDAYNRCALETLGAMVVDDLEFYHDKTGLAEGKQIFLESIKKNICGKVTRELVVGSLEVYPMHGYGAVEMGTHRFHHPGEQHHDVLGEAKFVMLWQYKDGAWKITRVISYDHQTVK
jgi:hypothetical protein